MFFFGRLKNHKRKQFIIYLTEEHINITPNF